VYVQPPGISDEDAKGVAMGQFMREKLPLAPASHYITAHAQPPPDPLRNYIGKVPGKYLEEEDWTPIMDEIQSIRKELSSGST
ncbi:MAG: hypothetical protein ACRD6W_03895, partial [Nitrososphaerales archaeon]